MKKLFLVLILLSFGSVCFADWNTYETRQEAYDRRSYENYNTYRNNNYQQPLGGYNRPMNDNGGKYYGTNYNNNGWNTYNSGKRDNSWNRL